LVDTDVFSWIRWQRGRFREFDDLVERHILALSFATVAELRAGVLIGAWGDKRRRIIEERIAQYVVLTATDAVTHRFSEVYARFRNQLKGDGR
jgi:predicted nucleic acid-binding protein